MKIISSSISYRISIRVLLFSCLLFIITLYFIYDRASEMYINETEKSTDFAYRSGCESINGTIKEFEALAKGVSWMVVDNYDNPKTLNEVVYNIVNKEQNIVGCKILMIPEYKNQGPFAVGSYIDSTSKHINTKSLYNDDFNYLVTDFYNITKILKKPTWSEPYIDNETLKTLSTYSIPLLDDENNVYCIVCIDISLEWLSEVANSVKVNSSSNAYIVSKGGVFIASSDKEMISNETLYCIAIENDDEEMLNYVYDILNGKSETLHVSSNEYNTLPDIDYDDTYTVFGPLYNGWGMIIVSPYSEILSSHKRMQWTIILIAILGLVLISFGNSFIIKKETSQLKYFSEAAQNISKGNFNTILPTLKFKDEIYDLRESLDKMQTELRKYIKDLKISTAVNERYASELNIAKIIQKSFIPSIFQKNEKFDIYGMVEPAKVIGGDLFDYNIIDNHLYFFIGDVSGKGVPASLYMSFIISAMNIVLGIKKDVRNTITEVNNYLATYNNYSVFVTMFYGCIDLKNYHFEYCNCGHNPIIIKEPNKDAEFLKAKSNIVMGVMDNFDFQTESMILKPGTQLLLYTDGVTEAEKSDFTQYSEEQLLKWCNNISKENTSREVTESLYASIKQFTDGNIQNDDITIFSIKINDNLS